MNQKQEPVTDLIFTIFRCNGALLEWGDSLTAEEGLTSSRWQVMGPIDELGPSTISGIARRMGLRRQSVQRTVQRMVEEGFLKLLENPEHRRAMLVDFTPKGKKSYDRIIAKYSKEVEKIQRELGETPAAFHRTQRFMEKFTEAIDSRTGE